MKGLRKIAAVLNSISTVLEKISNAICVGCLSLQVITIGIVVVGRYFFNKVPQGTEELALLCMVWIAMLSMNLSIREDGHMKMDVIDRFVKKDKIKYFQIACGIIMVIFNILMIRYGLTLWRLKWNSTMSGLPLSGAWQYLVLPIAGFLNTITSCSFFLNTTLSLVDSKGTKGAG